MFIWNLYWTIKLTIGYQSPMTGNEYIWGFGQVGAIVALLLSLSNALISYGGIWCIVLLGLYRTRSNLTILIITVLTLQITISSLKYLPLL
jgi:hypothetical protein